MALETRFRRLFWIDNRTSSAARFDMQTPWAVARFAAHVFGVLAFRLEASVSGCPKIAHDLFVAGRAFL